MNESSRTKLLIIDTLRQIANMERTNTPPCLPGNLFFKAMSRLARLCGYELLAADHASRLIQGQRAPLRAAEMLEALLSTPQEFDAIYGQLRDEQSIALLDRIVRFRTAWPFLGGDGAARAWPTTPSLTDYTTAITKARELATKLQLPPKYVAALWLLNHYTLPGICEVLPGDTVLDIGAFRGDSAQYFLEKCGPSGNVYAFEPVRAHIDEMNKRFAPYDNVTVVPHAVWNKQETLFIRSDGGSSHVCNDKNAFEVSADTIDAISHRLNIQRIDFIKMDVEGAEENAITGAEEAIQTHKPKLAISVYHKPHDLHVLTTLIHSINPDYQFYLRQYHPRHDETVLYAVDEPSRNHVLRERQ